MILLKVPYYRNITLLAVTVGILIFFSAAGGANSINDNTATSVSNSQNTSPQTKDISKTLTEHSPVNDISTNASEPLVIQLKYLKADKLQPILMGMFQNRIKVESINNSLLVLGSDEDYSRLKALLAQIDTAPRQIMFEAEAVEVSRDSGKNLGIDWESTTALPGVPTYDGSNFRIGLGIPNHPEYGINLKATINRLIEDKKGRLLASPRIAALDGQIAKILIGDRLAVESRQVVDGSEIISVTYIDVGIKLEVMPTINEDGTITTLIKPEVSNKTDATKNGNPNIRTRQAETTLRVRSGETIVIGGLIQREENRAVLKFPLLGDIPLVGHLFRSTDSEKKETELVILITPKIIDT